MKYTEVANRITGISCPFFGISWEPSETERRIAKRIIIYLEAKRVLYSPYELETVYPTVESVVEIKNKLTDEIPKMKENGELNQYTRAMRNACNKFLSRCRDDDNFRRYASIRGNVDNWIFTSAIGELRGVFGVMVGQISKAYGVDVEDELSDIIPE